MEYYLLESSLIFQVEGRDSTRYLQARLTNDVKKLEINSAIPAAALTAQGKIEGLFRVFKQSENLYFLISDGGDASIQLKALSRFIVADRVAITDITSEWSVIYISDYYNFDIQPDEIVYPSKRSSLTGGEILIKKAALPDKLITLNRIGKAIDSDTFNIRRVRLNLPQFGEEFQENMLFSECLIEDAISFQKGCYVGQEVVEKIDSRGEAPRIIVACESEEKSQIFRGDKVLDGQGEKTGDVLSWYKSTESQAGFIRVRNEPPFINLKTSSGVTLKPINL